LPGVVERAALSDLGAVALASAVAVGAWWSHPFPLAVSAAGVGAAFALRRPWLLVLAAAFLASSLGARAVAGMRPPAPAAYRGTVTLVGDPIDVAGGAQVEVRAGRRHLSLTASGPAAGSVRGHLAGDRLMVEGRIRPLTKPSAYLHARHVVGRMSVDRVVGVRSTALPWRLANMVHRAVGRAADWLPGRDRALYRGFLLGDARGQPVEVAADMRASGLGHLLVVSGENVAFLLTLLGPLLRRVGLRHRWLAVWAVVSSFAVLTRFEPSVLRAVAMAGLGAVAMARGTSASTLRLLALSVAGLVLLDPFLVHQVGFGLSVGATAGICLLGPPLADVLPGPRPLVLAAATTVAAQIGVAPLAVSVFGGLPVAALPANVLAAPAAAAVLVWGLPAGLLAQLLGGPVAGVLQFPTRLLVGWIAVIARWCAALPLGDFGRIEVALAAGAAVLVAVARRAGTRVRGAARSVAAALALVAVAVPWWGTAHPPARSRIAGGEVWRVGATVLVLTSGARPLDLFDALHRLGVRRIDLVVAPTGGLGPAGTIALLRTRWAIGAVLAPRDNEIRGATGATAGDRWQVGGLVVIATQAVPRLEVRVAPARVASPP
jgi:competence protein ComEC